MIEQKMDYINHNPVRGKWHLVDHFTAYPHLSAVHLEMGINNGWVTYYKNINVIL